MNYLSSFDDDCSETLKNIGKETELFQEDLHQENLILRNHLVELNKHIVYLSDNTLQKEKEHFLRERLSASEALRSDSETNLLKKCEEVKQLNNLVNEKVKFCYF